MTTIPLSNAPGDDPDWFCFEHVEDIPDSPGAYVLKIFLAEPVSFRTSKMGMHFLESGIYFYAGSARGPGGLRARIRRHFRKEKKIHWHVDQLTVQAVEINALVTTGASECELIEKLIKTGSCEHVLHGFGSTDCKTCVSHLLRVKAKTG